MKVSALISAALHLVILILMYTGLPLFQDPDILEESAIIEVEIVDISDITNLPKPTPEPEKEAEKEPAPKPEPKPVPKPESKPAPAPKPAPKPVPAPEPAPQPEPEPEPVPEPEPKVEPVPDPEPVPEATAKVVPKPRLKPTPKPAPKAKPEPKVAETPKKKELKFDLNSISALLDKKKREQPAAETTESDTKKSQSAVKVPNSSTKGGDASLPLSLSEKDAFKRQVQKCWNPPTGSARAEDLVVTIKITLNPDGTVQGNPEIQRRGAFKTRFEEIAAESARRAILLCQPYQLPLDKYERWRETTLNFDPREMF